MNVISFVIQPIMRKFLGTLSDSFFEKLKLQNKLKKIKVFQIKYENTFVDSNTFQKFLNEEKNVLLIFNYVFGATFSSVHKDAFVDQLSKLAMEKINQYRKSVQLNEIDNLPIVKQYFIDLITYLEGFRDKSFKQNEMSILANFQNSILESNNSLKIYFEENLYEILQRAFLKKYTDEYLEKILDRNLLDLGKRYNSEANVETDFNVVFDSIVADSQILEQFSNLVDKLNNSIVNLNIVLNKYKEDLEIRDFSFINNILTYIKQIDCNNKLTYVKSSLQYFTKEINSFIGELDGIRNKLYEDSKQNIKDEIIDLINQINKNERDINEYIYLVKPSLINEPYLLLYGDAGIGKSHLLADNAKRLQQAGHSVFLFLGQHLNSHEHPFKQIFDLIDYNGSKEFFFKEFNDRAIKKNKRTVIIIDALNEGAGKYFWKNYLLSFLNNIKEYENISVVFSVRSNFLRSVLPENIEQDFPLHKLEHKGFKNLSLESLEPFFNYFKINPLVFPSLENECYNPLFLQIYCEAIQEEYVGYRGWSIVEVLEKYIQKINSKLSLDERFPFSHSLNLVDNILKEIAKKFLDSESHYFELNQLYEVLERVASPFTPGYRELVLGLEEENVITINKGYRGESLVYFTYERFADIYISLVILEKFQQDKDLFKEILSSDNPFYYGVYESLSIVVPEKIKEEWLDIIDKNLITFDVAESYVRGISWRNVLNINERTFYWINIILSQNDIDLQSLVYERLLKQSFIIDSPLNAEFLHDLLYPLDMSIRDGSWTISINSNSEIPTQLLEIILKDNLSYKYFKYENFELLSTTIIWLFTCTDRKLRDYSTIALVKLYIDEPSIILVNVTRFIDVNDPYILERLFASLYGAILRTNEVPQFVEIIDIIYTNIFDQSEVYPNILIRDYASGIILFAANKGIINLEKYNKINRPYISEWYGKTYTLQDVDNKLKEIQHKAKNKYCGFYTITRSMTTEYGRGTGAYGDFGRYVFGSAVYNWRNQFDDQDLSNIATMRIIDYGYDEELHGSYDKSLQSYSRYENTVERIGKKYQWIALYELLAKLKDNFPIYKEVKIYTDEFKKYRELQLLKYYTQLDISNEVETVIEEPLKEEDNLIRIEKEYIEKNNVPLLRNIDPSLLQFPKEMQSCIINKSYLPIKADKTWAQSKHEFNKLQDFIFVEYNGHKYISLAQLLIQKKEYGQKYSERDEFCVKTRAIFLSNNDKIKYIDSKSKSKRELEVSWPTANNLFAFEYYWHPATIDVFYKNEFENIIYEDAIWEYSWERNININSGERVSCSYLLPNLNLVKFFNLHQTSEGVWTDESKNLVAFDAQFLGYEINLLFRADYLEEYLRENDLAMVWDFYMEKVSGKCRKEEWFISWVDSNEDIQHVVLDDYIDNDLKDWF